MTRYTLLLCATRIIAWLEGEIYSKLKINLLNKKRAVKWLSQLQCKMLLCAGEIHPLLPPISTTSGWTQKQEVHGVSGNGQRVVAIWVYVIWTYIPVWILYVTIPGMFHFNQFRQMIHLTHLPLDKMAVISQTTFLNEFLWMKSFVFWLKFHWSLFLWFQLTITQHWFK